MFYGASPEIFRKAKELRQNLTPSEQRMWECLKENRLDGYRPQRRPGQISTPDSVFHRRLLLSRSETGNRDRWRHT
ncbi:DUF559 domain-containing protein [Spirosoma areae]